MKAKVVDIVDGDTVVIRSDGKKQRVDLWAIDTAQLISGEKVYGRFVRDWLTGKIQKGEKFDIDFRGEAPTKGGPRQADIRFKNGDSLSELLLKKGYAFLDEKWEKRYNDSNLARLEKRAVSASKGLWDSWIDMGFRKQIRKVRRINRFAIANSEGGSSTPPAPEDGGSTPPAPEDGGSTPPVDEITRLPLFDPGSGSSGLTNDVKKSINEYNDNIAAYNRFSDCDFLGFARFWAGNALDDGYKDLAIAFNSANDLTDCGIADLLV